MNRHIKTKKDLLKEETKEKHLAELFNQCMRMMDAQYRKTHLRRA